MRLLAGLAAACLAVAVAAAPSGRPLAYPHLEPDLQHLRARCEGKDGRCGQAKGAALENCVRRWVTRPGGWLGAGACAIREGGFLNH